MMREMRERADYVDGLWERRARVRKNSGDMVAKYFIDRRVIKTF